MNLLFDLYYLDVLKGYYPFKWYSNFYGLDEIRSESSIPDIYTLCGTDENGKATAVITYYTDSDEATEKKIKIDLGLNRTFDIYLLDEEHDAEKVAQTDLLEFDMKPNTCIMIKEL